MAEDMDKTMMAKSSMLLKLFKSASPEIFLVAWQNQIEPDSVQEDAFKLLGELMHQAHSSPTKALPMAETIASACLHLLCCFGMDSQKLLTHSIWKQCISLTDNMEWISELLQRCAGVGAIDLELIFSLVNASRTAGDTAERDLLASLTANVPWTTHCLPESADILSEYQTCQSLLPAELVWQTLLNDQVQPTTMSTTERIQKAMGNLALRGQLLADPDWLMGKLKEIKPASSRAVPCLPHWAVLQTAAWGEPPEEGDGQSPLDGLDAKASLLVDSLSTVSLPLVATTLRALLDQQILVNGIQKGLGVQAGIQKALAAAENTMNGASAISEEEKTFTSKILAQLLVRPEQASILARLAQSLGRGLQEYLLQQVDWVLQDVDTLLGHQTLQRVLLKRFGGLLSPPVQGKLEEGTGNGGRLEQAFAELALACLGSSQLSQQKAFADQLVTQLRRLVAILQQNPRPKRVVDTNQAPEGLSAGNRELESATQRVPAAKDSSDTVESSFGVARARRMSLHQKASPGSVVGVRMAIWLRLKIIPSFLPLIYADRESQPGEGLRSKAAQACLDLLMSEFVYSQASPGDLSEMGSNAVAAATLSVIESSEGSLFNRLLQILQALVSGEWSSWIRGAKEHLRELPALATTGFQTQLDKATVPVSVRLKILSVMNNPPGPSTMAVLKEDADSWCQQQSPWCLPDWSAELQHQSGVQA